MTEVRIADDVVLGRHELVLIAGPCVIESGDHVIVFCTHKKLVRQVEKLFQVGFTFM